MNVPIPPDAEEQIASCSAIFREMKMFDFDAVVDLMRSQSAEVKSFTCTSLLDNEEFARSDNQYWCDVYKICREFLLDSIRDDLWNRCRLSRFEAARYVQLLFWRVWTSRPSPAKVLVGMRDDIATACRSADTGIVEAILLGILEHIFQDKQIAAFFSVWRDDPTLAKVFHEACALANGFERL